MVDDPGSISRARLFLESMVIPIAHNRFTYPTCCISVYKCLSAVGFWSSLANISVYQRFKETALRAVNPLYPPALSPPSKPGGERGPSGWRGVRREALGISGTAKEPYALEGTFRGWWMILLRSLECDCFSYPLRYPSRTTASRTLRISVHEC